MDISVEDKFVQTSSGRIHYLAAGQGRPLLLLHSNGGSAHEFEHVVPLLAERYRVVAWDMPGQGDSDPLTRYLSIHEYAARAAELATSLGLAKAGVAGASIGGSICIALAAHHGAIFEDVIAVETPCRRAEEWRSQWSVTEKMFSFASQTAEQVKPRLRHVDDDVLLRWNMDRNKAGPKSMTSAMWALREYDVVSDMRKVKSRVTAVFGSKSALRAKAQIFSENIPGCAVSIAEDCGHFPMLDDPQGFAALLIKALSAA